MLTLALKRKPSPLLPLTTRARPNMEIKYKMSNIVPSGHNYPSLWKDLLKNYYTSFMNSTEPKKKLGYSTYQKLESGLVQILQDNARNEWNTIKTTVNPSVNTLNSFNECITAFKRI